MTKNLFYALAFSALAGCAPITMESKESSDRMKKFPSPEAEKAGLYLYRDSALGGMLKKDLWVDGKCVGKSAPNVFFYTQVDGNRNHTITTESEFSPNTLRAMFESGKNYFVRQYIKIGLFIGGADLELIPEEKGKAAVSELGMATGGTCSK